jgi:alpha-D-ribose 1-methylphosphonate 5-triphosphate synthase subunit PhnH
MIVLQGQQAAFSCHENGHEKTEEEIQRQGEDKYGARSVTLVPEHPEHGQEEGQRTDSAGVQQERKQMHTQSS